MRFPNSLALFEASWTQLDPGVSPGPIIFGQTGTLVVESRDGKRIVRQERGHDQTTIHQCEPLPPSRDTIAREYIHHLETRQPVHLTLEMMFNLDAMAILDAGLRSTNSGKVELVNNAAWCLG